MWRLTGGLKTYLVESTTILCYIAWSIHKISRQSCWAFRRRYCKRTHLIAHSRAEWKVVARFTITCNFSMLLFYCVRWNRFGSLLYPDVASGLFSTGTVDVSLKDSVVRWYNYRWHTICRDIILRCNCACEARRYEDSQSLSAASMLNSKCVASHF